MHNPSNKKKNGIAKPATIAHQNCKIQLGRPSSPPQKIFNGEDIRDVGLFKKN